MGRLEWLTSGSGGKVFQRKGECLACQHRDTGSRGLIWDYKRTLSKKKELIFLQLMPCHSIFVKSATPFPGCATVRDSILTKNPELLPKKCPSYCQSSFKIKHTPGRKRRGEAGETKYKWKGKEGKGIKEKRKEENFDRKTEQNVRLCGKQRNKQPKVRRKK